MLRRPCTTTWQSPCSRPTGIWKQSSISSSPWLSTRPAVTRSGRPVPWSTWASPRWKPAFLIEPSATSAKPSPATRQQVPLTEKRPHTPTTAVRIYRLAPAVSWGLGSALDNVSRAYLLAGSRTPTLSRAQEAVSVRRQLSDQRGLAEALRPDPARAGRPERRRGGVAAQHPRRPGTLAWPRRQPVARPVAGKIAILSAIADEFTQNIFTFRRP